VKHPPAKRNNTPTYVAHGWNISTTKDNRKTRHAHREKDHKMVTSEESEGVSKNKQNIFL